LKAVRLARLSPQATDRRGTGAGHPTGPARRPIVKIGGAGVCRTDPAHHRGPVGTRRWARRLPYILGHEKRRLGARGRIRGQHNVAVGRQTVILHPTPTLRAVLCLPGRQRHALRRQRVPRACPADGGMAEYLRTSARRPASSSTRRPGRPDVAALRPDAGHHGPTHAVRKAHPAAVSRPRPCVVIGAGGLGPYRHPVLGHADRGHDHRGGPQPPDALKLAEQLGARHTVVADGKARDYGGRDDRRAMARKWCSTSSPSRGPRNDGFAMTRRAGLVLRDRLRRPRFTIPDPGHHLH